MRLIDADALIERIGEWMPHDKCGEEDIKDVIYAEACVDLIDVIKDAPTVEHCRWIPVSDKRPNVGKDVLVSVDTADSGDCWVTIAYMCYDLTDNEYWFQNDEMSFDMEEVFAWMPLPDVYAPQESEDKE